MNGIYAIKPLFQQSLKPIESSLIGAKVHPDVITYAALALSVAGAAALSCSSEDGMLYLLCCTPIVALGRTMLNALDGMVATKTGQARPWGEVLNEFCDRLADIALFAGLAMSRLCNGQMITVSIVSMLLSSYMGILSKAAGSKRQYGGVMGKADRMVLLALFGPLAFALSKMGVCSAGAVLDVFVILVIGGSLITTVQRANKAYADLKSTK